MIGVFKSHAETQRGLKNTPTKSQIKFIFFFLLLFFKPLCVSASLREI